MTWTARRTAVLLLLVAFVAGAVGGWLLDEVVDDFHWPARAKHGEHRSSAHGATFDDDEEEDFLESLDLTRAQHDSVDRLLDAGEDRLEDYWATRLPEMRSLLDSTRVAIRAVLTPEQRAAYDRWLAGQRQPDFKR